MLSNMDQFVEKWKDITHSEVPLLNGGALNEIEKLKVHITHSGKDVYLTLKWDVELTEMKLYTGTSIPFSTRAESVCF